MLQNDIVMTKLCKNTLNVGDVLKDNWVILEFVGKGGMGEVYRAHQTNLKRDVAIKVISREWLESLENGDEEAETITQRFRREVQSMAQIRHPNILHVFDHGSITVKKCDKDTDVEYIAMEYIPGGSLRDTMSLEGFYPEEDAIKAWIKEYFFPVLDGVQALHDSGIVHRDIKPENIFIDGKIPKIADFGLARSVMLKPLTQSIDVKGSPLYMSPEHFFDFRRADQRADIYSLGKILFEAVDGKIPSGTMPFKSASLTKPESTFFQKLDQVIQDATVEDREKRTVSVKDFHDELQKAINITHGEKPKDASTPVQSKSIFARPKWIWSGIIVATFSVLLMTIWHLLDEPGLSPPKAGLSVTSHQETAAVQSGNNEKGLKLNSVTNSFVFEHLGKQHLIPGGQLVLPTTLEENSGKSISVAPFYMDEFLVTNQQYVEFLNYNLSRISMENGVIKGDGANWILLGEVYEGYEPIIYRNEEFHVSNPSYTSSPVLRVTGYGASAFAKFFGRRLPTEAELLYSMVKGVKDPQPSPENTSNRSNRMNMDDMMHEMGGGMMEWDWRKEKSNMGQYGRTENNTAMRTSKEPPPASFYDQNAFGIRGLNEGIGEWAIRAFSRPSKAKPQGNMFAVIGGLEGHAKGSSSIPSVISRFPWESFEEVGFRTVLSLSKKNQ
jgi:eukaryotic-like serine/threonine-protein kinase